MALWSTADQSGVATCISQRIPDLNESKRVREWMDEFINEVSVLMEWLALHAFNLSAPVLSANEVSQDMMKLSGRGAKQIFVAEHIYVITVYLGGPLRRYFHWVTLDRLV